VPTVSAVVGGVISLNCRALLSNARIVAIDEATANVDRATDVLIQETLRRVVSAMNKTLLVIAHRIDTVMDCDLILVISNGSVEEFGHPSVLLCNKKGAFSKIVRSAQRLKL